MRTMICAALLMAALPGAAQAQDAFSGYDTLEIIHCDELSLSLLDGRIEYLKGGVDIQLKSGNPAFPPLPLKCDNMFFDYAEDSDGALSRVRLEGNVDVTHPQARVRAGRAVWDFETNVLTFEGNPVIDTAEIKGMRAEKITINLTTNEMLLTGNVSVEELPLSKQEDPSKLKLKDIKDWNALLGALQTQAKGEAASPGKHLVGLMEEGYQQSLRSLPVETLLLNKADLLRLLNGLLKRPDFYDEAAWQGVAIHEATRAALAGAAPSGNALTKMNRALLEAAFPAAF